MADRIPLAFFAPTVYGIPALDDLRRVQVESVERVGGSMMYVGEHKGDWPRHVYDKLVQGYKEAIRVPGVIEHGLVVMMHHDTVIESPEAFRSLIEWAIEENLGAVGAPEYDGIRRFNVHGHQYLQSCFQVINPRAAGLWWHQESWDGLLNWEDYWHLQQQIRRNGYDVVPLNARWRAPRIGGAVTYTFRGGPVATHLWCSTFDLRGDGLVEGNSPEQIRQWREEFIRAYTRAEDQVRGLDESFGPGEAGERAAVGCEDGARGVPALALPGDSDDIEC